MAIAKKKTLEIKANGQWPLVKNDLNIYDNDYCWYEYCDRNIRPTNTKPSRLRIVLPASSTAELVGLNGEKRDTIDHTEQKVDLPVFVCFLKNEN